MDEYERLEKVGEGAYGKVYKAREKATDEIVALKIINMATGVGLPSTALRETAMLMEMRHPNIIRLRSVKTIDNDELCLVFDYLEMDFKKYTDIHRDLATNPQMIKKFLYQILEAVAYCHARRMIHRDLKPQNLLIDSNTNSIKVADFGLARVFCVPVKPFTNEVITLHYRPPEILMGSGDYSTPVDIWSVGCIFAEMVNQKTFFPGTSQIDQLRTIYAIMGTPNEENWPGVSCLPDFREFPFQRAAVDLATVVPNLDPVGIDLLTKMLRMDPSKRINANEALAHEYFNKED